MIIEKGNYSDLDKLEQLYNDLNDYFVTRINYPGWIKGIYPVRETAKKGIDEGTLFVLKMNNVIAGSVILNHEPENAYDQVIWDIDISYEEIIVIHTFVIHPRFMNRGIGSMLMDFIKEYSIKLQMKAIRLDVSEKNIPAILLYEKHGYKYIGTVDLGLEYEHLKWFKLYELLLF